jgi:hypothetical protein
MKVLLCNDTAIKSHIGCQAVSNAHARMLGRLGHKVQRRYFVNELSPKRQCSFADMVRHLERNEEFISALAEVEAVIVNGEGTIHHDGGLDLVAALYIAKKRGKAALLVNCLFQNVEIDPDVLNSLDYFSVRDARSFHYAASRGIRCVQRFDSIVAADFSGKNRQADRNIKVTDWTKSSDALAGEISARLLTEKSVANHGTALFPLHCASARKDWDCAVASLAEAVAVVTSRHHGIYLGILAGVPTIALHGNTWKVPGLLDSLGIPVPLCTTYQEVRTQLASLDSIKKVVAAARNQLLDASDLQHFSILGRGSDSAGEQDEVARLSAHIAARPSLLRRDVAVIKSRRRRERKRARAARWTSLMDRW